MANLSIKSKLLAMLLAVSLFSIAVVASLNYYTCYKSLQNEVYAHLTSVRASRADQIEQFIERLRKETSVIGGSAISSGAARAFIDAYRKLDGVTVDPAMDAALREFYQKKYLPALAKETDSEPELNALLPETPQARYLQYQYIAKNPFPFDQMDALMKADDASAYTTIHEKFHAPLRRIALELGFIDAYLVDIETSEIVYSMMKGPDFATRLSDG